MTEMHSAANRKSKTALHAVVLRISTVSKSGCAAHSIGATILTLADLIHVEYLHQCSLRIQWPAFDGFANNAA